MSRISIPLLPVSLCVAFFGSAGLLADETLPARGGRPVPHPDILSLPAETASPAGGQAAPLKISTPSADLSIAEANESVDPESRPIARREGTSPGRRADSESQALPPRGSTGNRGLFRDLWPLLAVLVLVAGLALLLKKYMPARGLMAGSQVLQIAARTHVSSKQQLMLVKLGRRLVLIGVSPERIGTLAMVDDPDQVAMIMGEIASSAPGSISRAFADSIDEEAEAYVELPVNDPTGTTHGHIQGLLQKVRTLSGKS